MKTVAISDLKAHLSAYLKMIDKAPVAVTRNGKPVAVLLAVTDEDELERLIMAHSPQLQAILDAARTRMDRGEGIPSEQFWKQVESDNVGPKKRRKKTGSSEARP
jgi:prevent-host-death family protein